MTGESNVANRGSTIANITAESITTVPTVHQRPIAALFKHMKTFEDVSASAPLPNNVGSVPIYTSKVALVASYRPVFTDALNEEDHSHEKNAAELYEVKRFKEVKEFKPKVLMDQLNEGCLSGLTNLSNSIVEQLLNDFFGTDAYEWTSVESDGKVVFVRFKEKSLKENAMLIKRMIALEGLVVRDSKLEVAVEKNTQQLVQDTVGDLNVEVDLEELQTKVSKIIESHKEKKSTTELDYVIDENELKDLPKDVLPQLVKDIKEFRLKALENEKKKREKEVLEEKKRSKAQLRQLFEKFQNDSDRIIEDDDDDDSDDGEEDDLTDEQYEELRVKKENAEMLRKFNDKLRQVEAMQRRNKDLAIDLEDLKKYKTSLDKTIRPEYPLGKFRPSGRNKELELDADKRDREEEATEGVAAEQSEAFLASINLAPLKLNIGKNTNILEIDDTQLDSILEQMKPKIDEYIEEALGVKEDELSEYVVSIIKDEKSKEKLFEELQEPFGEDASSLVEKVWADVRELVDSLEE